MDSGGSARKKKWAKPDNLLENEQLSLSSSLNWKVAPKTESRILTHVSSKISLIVFDGSFSQERIAAFIFKTLLYLKKVRNVLMKIKSKKKPLQTCASWSRKNFKSGCNFRWEEAKLISLGAPKFRHSFQESQSLGITSKGSGPLGAAQHCTGYSAKTLAKTSCVMPQGPTWTTGSGGAEFCWSSTLSGPHISPHTFYPSISESFPHVPKHLSASQPPTSTGPAEIYAEPVLALD